MPGNAKESLLYKLVSHAREPHMPFQGKKLPDETILHIAAWIDNGAPYDEPLAAVIVVRSTVPSEFRSS